MLVATLLVAKFTCLLLALGRVKKIVNFIIMVDFL